MAEQVRHRQIGEAVVIKSEPEVTATIIGVLLRESGVEYEIAWFANHARQTAWVWSSEIAAYSGQRGQCGFATK